ncbi:FAD-dependent oxidoreductase [Pontiella sulfatireligans]|uniref:Coenzyme A disulfide reductase n=1 Tax=Pontiella sulfatireligans TaxID=2750658 RepID=A0A6C2USN7_9BACT|nr:FAD-dependent oxidoreductase [Pontiella sulfatireligans]VGO22237.1 Coenzyme A disulfide reductase [Pontiella sulfatireligans]
MNMKKLLIIGGVAGGASAAARARRLDENAEIILFERGPDISFANCGLPYHIGGTIADREKLLVTTPQMMTSKFNIDVRTLSEVVSIDREKKEIAVKNLKTGEEYTEAYDALVLSPGAAPIRPPIPGIDNPNVLTLRNLEDMDLIIQSLANKKSAAVIGGGYIGLEMAEALREIKMDTTLIELAPQVMGPADPEMASVLHQELRLFGVNLKLETSVTAFEEAGDGVDLILSDGERLHVDLAILAIGVKPEATLAVDAGLELGTTGGIKVNDHMLTSDPAIYAVGDAVEVTDFTTGQPALIPLAGPANRQGRIAADNIFGGDSSYKNTQGTAICKVFNLAIGMTGLSEKMAKRQNISYEKVYVHPASHASYYPGSHPISLKLLFDPASGKVLGAQAVGADGVDKRIDVLAVAIRAGLTVYDLEEMELTYAPPYGSAKDAVNYAGFVASNVLRGDAKLCHVEDVCNPTENQMVVDVRNPEEVEGGTVPGAKNIPLGQLRGKLDELSKDREYLILCQVGLRGYLACRIMTQNGFKCRNLTGGYKTYSMTTAQHLPDVPENDQSTDDPGAETINMTEKESAAGKVVKHIDTSGLQCPGPIMSLKTALDELQPGEALTILSTDHGFAADIPAWCNSTGNQLDNVAPAAGGGYEATITKRQGGAVCSMIPQETKRFTNVVFSNDLDRALASFIIANGAATMGYEVTLFFTFWGLNILRKNGPMTLKKTMIEKMFGRMMPQGPDKLSLSQLHMAGMGTAMMKDVMKKKNVSTLPELIKAAQANGVKMVACTMTMDLMGIKSEELIDGLEEGGVAMYIDHLGNNANLFI